MGRLFNILYLAYLNDSMWGVKYRKILTQRPADVKVTSNVFRGIKETTGKII